VTLKPGSPGAGTPSAPALLAVGNFFRSAGTVQYCEELARRLEESGHVVIRTSESVARTVRLVDMVATAVRRRREYAVAHVDVFSGRSFVWAEAVTATLRMLGKPVVLTLHGGSLPEFSRRHPGRVRRLLRAADIVTAPSRYLCEALQDLREHIEFVPNAIERSAYLSRVRSPVRPRIVWLRAFHRIYRPEDAPRVLAAVREFHPDALLSMVGSDKDGSLRSTRKVARDLGVEDAVRFTGRVPKDEVPAVLAEHDVFLNTTSVDNTPVSVMEAMAGGLCVISTAAGGIPYLLDDGRTGLVRPVGDVAGLAAAVVRVLDDPALAASLSESATRAAMAFDWSVVLPRWESLLASVQAGRSPQADRRKDATDWARGSPGGDLEGR